MFDSLFPKHWTTLQRLMWLKTNALARAVYEIATGNPVSFTAKAAPLKQLSVAFSPKQDLNGYDSPWPAGGGKNKFNPAEAFPMSGYGTFIPADVVAGQTYTASYADAETGASYAQRFYIGGSWVSAGTSIPSATLKAGYTFTAAEGATKYAINGYVDGAKYQLEKGSSATSYAPNSNICPILGWDSLNVEQRGKNLFDKDSANITNGWWYAPDLVVGEPLGNYAASGNYHTSAPIPVVAGQTYTVVGCGGGNGSFLYLDKGMNYLDGFANASQSSRTFTVPNNPQIAYLRFPFATATVDTCQLELGSTATAYVPYNPSSRSISITLGSTVYSGTVDVLTGVVTVDTEYKRLLSSWTWNYGTATGGLPFCYTSKIAIPSDLSKLKCDHFKTVTTNSTLGIGRSGLGLLQVWVKDLGITSSTEFKTYLTENEINAVIPLESPLTIQLTQQEAESLAGDNVMWSDANGDLTVEYRSN